MNRSTIGITGSSGFIGTHLIEVLRKSNINLIPFEGNLLNEANVARFFAFRKISTIIHLAGRFLPPFKKQVESNLLATEMLLRIGTAHGLKKIIFTSSGAVYGEPQNSSAQESDILLPNTNYGLTKKYAEDVITYYSRHSDLGYVILRLANVYGNGSKGVIYDMIQSIKTNNKVIIHGNGEQMRNFIHVSDACQGIIKALEYSKSDVFNISNPVDLTINELVKELGKNYSFQIEYQPSDNRLNKLSLKIEKARKLLSFEPTVTSLSIDETS